MHRIHAGRPLGRPLRNRSQAMKKERGPQATKNTRPWPNCRGFPWEARQRDFITAHSSIMAGFYEPRATIFLRDEGHSRRCCSFESVAAKRRLSPRRPAAGGADRPPNTCKRHWLGLHRCCIIETGFVKKG